MRKLSWSVGWVAIVASGTAALILILMFTFTLPRLSDFVKGVPPFDLRPSGYTFDEARDLLMALGAQGRDFYGTVQVPLDTLLALAYGAGLGCAVIWLLPPARDAAKERRVVAALSAVLSSAPFLAGIFDLWENWLVYRMLTAEGDPNVRLVAEASRTTTFKFGFLAITGFALIWGLLRWRSSRRAGG